MKLYVEHAKNNGYTWFSTQSLFYGMSPKKVKEYNDKIKQGKNVKLLFALNSENYDNDIAFSANISEIYSSKTPEPCPDGENYPREFKGELARIWMKLTDIKEENTISASMLEITSTGRNLKQTIANAQYHFGYVSLKEEYK